MTPLHTRRLIIRNWQPGDRNLFRLINADPEVMRFFPFRRSDEEADAFMELLTERIARDGFDFTALERKEDGACIGFCGLSRTDIVPARPEGAMEIGWRLAPAFQKMGYATEAAEAWLAFGFGQLKLDEIVSFAVAGNVRSTAVMERIGMEREPAGDFDHPNVPANRQDLRRHIFYRLSRDRWDETKKAD